MNWPWLILGLVLVYTAVFIVKFIRHRKFYADLPKPPHSPFWGNLKVMGEGLKNYPADMHPQPLFTELAKQHGLRGLYYLDLYPFSESFIFIIDPAVAIQTQTTSSMFFRHPGVDGYLRGLVGTKSIFSVKGKEWQQQKSWFVPAFSLCHLLNLVPGMIEETLVFRENLAKFSVSGEVFPMNDAAMRLAIDIIGRTVGDIRLQSQSGYSPIQDACANAIEWTAGQTDPLWKKIVGPFLMDWYTRKLDKLLGEVIKEKYAKISEDGVDKSILDLALRGYLKDNGKSMEGKSGKIVEDQEFMRIALDNAKVFFTGGHDTTASLITYTFYMLFRHPEILSRVRAEHDQVFGADFQRTISTIQAEPHLLNKLPLTAAVHKEVLRLFTAGFTIKKGLPGATLTFEGRTYPADNHIIANLAPAMHRSAEFFTNPSEFDPDRWLTPGVDKSGAWQPFEKGPRSCIGLQLSLLEVKIIAVLTLRDFDFEACFKENSPSIPGWGGRAYQQLKLTAKPKDGIPMRVKLRSL